MSCCAADAAALQFVTTTCPSGTQYQEYTGCTISVTGGTPPYTWSTSTSASYASLPEGLSLNPSNGAISATQILGQGGYGVLITVTDSTSTQISQQFNFAIAGANAWMSQVFAANSVFKARVDAATTGLPVYSGPGSSFGNNSGLHPSFGANPLPQPNGIPAIQVASSQTPDTVASYLYQFYFGIAGAGDSGSCTSGLCPIVAPIPANTPVEGSVNACSGDGHALIYQTAGNGTSGSLWEMWQFYPSNATCYRSGGSTTYQDSSNFLLVNPVSNAPPPFGYGTTDAAGLPILPLLPTADEVIGTGTPTNPNGSIPHALRFTMDNIIPLKQPTWPATTGTAGDASCTGYSAGQRFDMANPPAACPTGKIPFGARMRLKSSIYESLPACFSSSPQAKIVVTALYQYGMFFADNGSYGYITGTPDSRWVDSDLQCLHQITLQNFEMVNESSLAVNGYNSDQVGSVMQNGVGGGVVP